MPVVTVRVPTDSLSDSQKAAMIGKMTDVVIEVEGIPAIRPYVYVLIEEVPVRGYGVGGLDVEAAKAARAAAATKK